MNINDIKELDEYKIYELLNPIFTSLYKEYDYIFDEVELKAIVLHEIRKSKENYLEDVDYNIYINDVIIRFLDGIIISYINCNRQIDLINKYINKNFNNVSNFKESICCIKKLESLLDKYNIQIHKDMLFELINNNKIFSNAIELIVNQYYKQIVSGNLEYIFNDYIIVIIIETYCTLNNIEIKKQEEDNYDNVSENKYKKSIYEYLEDYSKEEIDLVISKLSVEEQKLLRLRYGEDLSNPVFEKLTKEQTYKFYNLIKKIKKILKNEGLSDKNRKSIYEFMEGYSKEEVDLVLDRLNCEEREILRLRYGEDLSNPVFSKIIGEQRRKFYNLIYTIRVMLKKRHEDTKYKNTVYKLLEDYSKEEIDLVISKLTTEEQALLKIRYGEDLSNPVFGELTKEQHYKFYDMLLPKIKRILEYKRSSLKLKTIYEYLEDYSKEEIDSVISKLTTEEQELLRLKYGEDLDNPIFGKLSKEQRYKFYKCLLIKIKRMLKNGGLRVKYKTIYENFIEYNKEEVDYVISNLSYEDLELIRMRYGEDLDNPVFEKLTQEQNTKFYYSLLPRMKTMLKNNGKTKKLIKK